MAKKVTISIIKCDVGSLAGHKFTAFDGPPRIVALGFQIANGKISSDDEGKPLVADLFDDPAFSMARHEAVHNGSTLRRMGEFEPARLSAEEMEYTTIQQVLQKLEKRFTPLDQC